MSFDEIFNIVSYVVDQYRQLKADSANVRAENAQLKADLATALGNDKADADAIAAAKADAQTAKEELALHQAKDADELAKLQAAVQGIELPATEPSPATDEVPVVNAPGQIPVADQEPTIVTDTGAQG